ncbi:MAG: ActS/PrrB/RegB family redox-sensitive histidine kinase, partial [Alphaproteobacteria bacterium]|nr:ActS/PrrB/RegB family redox-sensitive histidine kinase [Alphaproteobacteria bacterium]
MFSPFALLTGSASPALKREGNIRTHSLILLRWLAVFGQLLAIGITVFGLGFSLPLYECLFLIGILGLSNLYMGISTSQSNRMSNYHTARLLAFDMIQLSALFYFTGGLENPFSLTLIVPVTIAATLLSRGATTMLTILALFCVTFLAFYHEPLPYEGSLLDIHTGRISVLYLGGIWVAIAAAIILVAIYLWSLTEEARATSEALRATESALLREQNISAVGGLAAAAAHELGSPLATIALVTKELMHDVPQDNPIYEDIELLHQQSLRCKDILSGLSQNPVHKGGQAYEKILLHEVIELASQDHLSNQIVSELTIDNASIGPEPVILPSAELMHGLGNIYSNAAQFAADCIKTNVKWDHEIIQIRIQDDGPGFPPLVLENFGQPYL